MVKANRQTSKWGVREPQPPAGRFYRREDMWQFWEWNGKYIQGNLVIEHSSKATIISKVKKRLGKDIKLIEDNRKDEKIIWIDNPNNIPIGIIKKLKGAKRIRQGKKE